MQVTLAEGLNYLRRADTLRAAAKVPALPAAEQPSAWEATGHAILPERGSSVSHRPLPPIVTIQAHGA